MDAANGDGDGRLSPYLTVIPLGMALQPSQTDLSILRDACALGHHVLHRRLEVGWELRGERAERVLQSSRLSIVAQVRRNAPLPRKEHAP